MFNMNQTGKKIAELRKAANMTQMELADKMNISFQAVSNWERGISMPDISKLPELAELFGVSVDVILGKKSEIIESAVAGNLEEYARNNNVSTDELTEAAPMLKPNQIDTLMEGVKPTKLRKMISLMPFLSTESVDNLVITAAQNGDFDHVSSAAPFASSDALGKTAELMIEAGKSLSSIAPFIKGEQLTAAARKKVERGERIDDIVVFLDTKTVDELAIAMARQGRKINSIAPFASSDALDKAAALLTAQGKSISGLAPFMNGDMIGNYVFGAIQDSENDLHEQNTDTPEGSTGKAKVARTLFFTSRKAKAKSGRSSARNAHDEKTGQSFDSEKSFDDIFKHVEEYLAQGKSIDGIIDELDEDELDRLALRMAENGMDTASLIDDMSENGIDALARLLLKRNEPEKLTAIADSVSDETLEELAEELFEAGGMEALTAIAEYVDSEVLAKLAAKAITSDGIASIAPIADYLDEDELGKYIKKLL